MFKTGLPYGQSQHGITYKRYPKQYWNEKLESNIITNVPEIKTGNKEQSCTTLCQLTEICKIVNFLENYNQLKLIQEEINDLNPIIFKDIKSLIKSTQIIN